MAERLGGRGRPGVLLVAGMALVAVGVGVTLAVWLVLRDRPGWLSLRHGLTVGALQGQAAGLVAASLLAVPFVVAGAYTTLWGEGIVDALSRAATVWCGVFVAVAVASGVHQAMAMGTGPWLFHYWLRFRLARRGDLPRPLPRFLAWCASPRRDWLRGGSGYEFRHRSLLDHLAPDVADASHAGVPPAPGPPTPGTAVPAQETAVPVSETAPPLLPNIGLGQVGLVLVVVLAGVIGGIWVIGGFQAALSHEFGVDYVDGDRPRRRTVGARISFQWHDWTLAPGAEIRTVFRVGNIQFYVPDDSPVDALHGDLRLDGCDAAEIAWEMTVDGDVVAEGTIEAPDNAFDDTEETRLGEIGLRGVDDTTTFVLTARRVDRDDCDAVLHWVRPGFDTPGIGSF